MKKRIVLSLAIIAGVFYFFFQQRAESKKLASSQTRNSVLTQIKPQSVRAAASGVSRRVSDFAKLSNEKNVSDKTNPKLKIVSEIESAGKSDSNAAHDAESNFANLGNTPMPAPSLSFDGLSNEDNITAYNLLIIPPDMIGDAGPNHYVQAVNALVRVYDKQGNPLTSPFKFSDIFAPLGTPCSVRNDGLPNVLYDPLTDRWLISQYCNLMPPFRQMIAVSKTNDPTGEYYLYEFIMPNNDLNDYAKFGVWTDAFYMATEQFFGSDYDGTGAFAFDKNKMLAGDPAASYIYFDIPSNSLIRRGGMLPSDIDGLRPPPDGAPNVFMTYTATEYGDAQDALRLFNFHADFENPQNSTFTERLESPLTVAPFDPTSPDGRQDISQPSPGEKLDSNSDRLMYRLAYRNFGTRESLVVNQTVRTTPADSVYQAGVRVYQLDKTNGVFSVREQTTIGDASLSRFIGAAAQDHQGNLAVEYNTSSAEKKPAISYTGKLASDAPGNFREEATLIQGTGVQKAFGWRWGDYSGMTIDPVDDCSFWMTNAYYTLESENRSDFSWLTRIGKFRFAECTNAPRSTITGTVVSSADGSPILEATVTANSAYRRITNASGNYGSIMLLPGTYNLTASARGYRSQTISVTVADGQTLTQNFALEPAPFFDTADANITAESCQPNNRFDPSENVTVNIGLSNIGNAPTTNLVVTLLPAGGVTNPGAPQNYGVVTGTRIYRPFSFTVSPNLQCGENIVLTLHLQDGAEDLGTVTIEEPTGQVREVFREDFGFSTSSLPAGWTTSATGGQTVWNTVLERHQTPPASAFSPDPNQVGLNEMTSPAISITSPNAEIEFQNWYELETTFLRNRLYDGSVLEIKIGANDWQDIETAGGTFLQGGYDGVIDTCCQNPLGGRRGWSGRSGSEQTSQWITSRAKLPASAAGQNVRFRWRVGTDTGTFREGQYIDDVVVSDGSVCACQNNIPNRPVFDFDGDGKTDVSIFRADDNPNNADFYILNSGNSTASGYSWGSTGDKAVNADYDGDGKTDIAVYRAANSTWFILRSSDLTVRATSFVSNAEKLVPADYDGDGKADLAVFEPSNGFWSILQSTNNQIRTQQFGIAEDIPTAADFDGDGKTDIAVYRPSTGVWYVLRSSDGGFNAVRFGLSGDKPVAGDFDGDGRADYVVYRPSNGNWYLLQTQNGFAALNFGLSEDKPLQGDFDGDGKRDIAVYRPSNGVWYILKSSDNGFFGVQFGLNGDTAVPSVFVP